MSQAPLPSDSSSDLAQIAEEIRLIRTDAHSWRRSLEPRPWFKRPTFWIGTLLTASIASVGWILDHRADQRAISQRAYDLEQRKLARLTELTEGLHKSSVDPRLALAEVDLLETELRRRNAPIPYVQYLIMAEASASLRRFRSADQHFARALNVLETSPLENRDLERFRILLRLFDFYREWTASYHIGTELSMHTTAEIARRVESTFDDAVELAETEAVISGLVGSSPRYDMSDSPRYEVLLGWASFHDQSHVITIPHEVELERQREMGEYEKSVRERYVEIENVIHTGQSLDGTKIGKAQVETLKERRQGMEEAFPHLKLNGNRGDVRE